MPIYEYRCSACGHELEALQKLSDALLVSCPQCGKNALSKLMSAGGFKLKGSGWYATDFKNSGSRPAAKGAAGAEAKTDSGAAKSEAKPAGESKPESRPGGESKPESKPASDAPVATTGATRNGS